MPANTVYVGRPTKWGNPWIPECDEEHQQAVDNYRDWMLILQARGLGHDLSELGGKDLCCWCPPGQPCHADILLELANG